MIVLESQYSYTNNYRVCRKSIRFSKSLIMHEIVVGLVIILVSIDIFLSGFPAPAGDGKTMEKFIAHGYNFWFFGTILLFHLI